jgi:hypothetical protein
VAAVDEEEAVAALGRAVEAEILAGPKRLAVDDQLLAAAAFRRSW